MFWKACVGVFISFLAVPSARCAAPAGTGDATLRFGAPPAWVERLDAPAGAPAADDDKRGVAYALMDRQFHRGLGERHVRYAYRITSPSGVQDNSEVRLQWNPAFETATIHHVRRTRAGATEDLAQPERFQTMRREQNLSLQVVDGRLSAVAHLEDVRVGDVLDVAYTIRGQNPVFGGRFSASEPLEFAEPVRLVQVRVVRAAQASFAHRLHGRAKPEHRVVPRKDGSVDERWTARDVPAVLSESEAPAWAELRSYVEFSEFRDWGEVIAWGMELFRSEGPLPPELESRAAEIEAATPDPEERVARAARLAQEELRYLSLSIGENSHRPAPPAESFRRRFGDCKDKALLLSVLLRRLGLDAAPALVDSDGGHLLPEKLPSAGVFDHCVVRLRHDGATYWIDATRTHQGTGLSTRFVPDFSRALVFAAGETALAEVIRPAEAKGRVEVSDRIDCRKLDEPALMTSEYLYVGLDAERVREHFATSERAKISRRNVDFMRRHYGPAVEEALPWKIEDDPRANRILIREQHRLPDFWTTEGNGQRKAFFKPTALTTRVDQPEMTERRTPLAVRLPSLLRHRIEAQLPDMKWNPAKDRTTVRGPGFEFEYEYELGARLFTADYVWRTTARTVAPAEAAEHARQVAAVERTLGDTLTTPAAEAPFRMNWTLLGVMAAAGALSWRWLWGRARRPASPRERERIAAGATPVPPRLVGLGGWMILVGLRVFVSPIVLAWVFWTTGGRELLDVDLVRQARENANGLGAAAEPLLFGIMALVAALFAVLLVLPLLFSRRHFRFRRWMLVTLWGEVATMAGLLPFESAGEIATAIRDLLWSVVLALYLHRSRRGRGTFTWDWNENLAPPPAAVLPPSLAETSARLAADCRGPGPPDRRCRARVPRLPLAA